MKRVASLYNSVKDQDDEEEIGLLENISPTLSSGFVEIESLIKNKIRSHQTNKSLPILLFLVFILGLVFGGVPSFLIEMRNSRGMRSLENQESSVTTKIRFVNIQLEL